MKRGSQSLMAAFAAALFFATGVSGQTARSAQPHTPPLRSPRLYVFDCGTIHVADTGLFGLKKEEVATSDLSVPCFLIVHPKGTLFWDAGAVPDADWTPTGAVTHHVVLPDHQ